MKKALLFIILTLAVGSAQAVTFEGTAVGGWHDVDPGPFGVWNIDNNDLGDISLVEWGIPLESTTSAMAFDGIGSDGDPGFSVSDEDPFLIGYFGYLNGTQIPGTGITGVDLSVLLTLTSPLGLNNLYEFDFSITNALIGPDTVTIAGPVASTIFIYDDEEYTLEILGFSTDDGATITSEFTNCEDHLLYAGLYAKITSDIQQLPPVPEPATISLLGLGLAGIIATRLRKRG